MDQVLNLIKLYRFDTRWRSSCLRRVLGALELEALAGVRATVAEALEAEDAFSDLELNWTGHRRRRMHAPEARQLDAELDRALAGVGEVLRATGKIYGADSPQAQAATRAHQRLFPGGVASITRLAWVSQFETVNLILKFAREPELAATLRSLGLEPAIQRIAEVNARFGVSLRPEPEGPTFPQLAQAREEGQRRLQEVVVLLVARRLSAQPGAERDALARALNVILGYNRALGRYRKRRRQRKRAARAREAEDTAAEKPGDSTEASTPAGDPVARVDGAAAHAEGDGLLVRWRGKPKPKRPPSPGPRAKPPPTSLPRAEPRRAPRANPKAPEAPEDETEP